MLSRDDEALGSAVHGSALAAIHNAWCVAVSQIARRKGRMHGGACLYALDRMVTERTAAYSMTKLHDICWCLDPPIQLPGRHLQALHAAGASHTDV